MVHPPDPELHCTPHGVAQPNCATLYPTELFCTLLSYAAMWATSWDTVPTVLVPLCNFFKCRNTELSGDGIKVRQSGTGMLRHRTEMLIAGIGTDTCSIGLDADAQPCKRHKIHHVNVFIVRMVCSSHRILFSEKSRYTFRTEIHENSQKEKICEMSIGSLCSTNVFLKVCWDDVAPSNWQSEW